ncbi:MAG TPA: glycosyltransferase [Solirubrobacterales bacterium]|nr:glycosyltransferase [Solirubrobacterales bacterium]
MKLAIVSRLVLPEGGLTLSAFRLAAALAEAGHEAEVIYDAGEPPADLAAHGRRVAFVDGPGPVSRRLAAALEAGGAEAVLVDSGQIADLRAAAAVAPAAVHANMHDAVCPDRARYWARAKQPCRVRAGWRCAALRPALGCSGLRRSLDPRHITAQREILDLLRGGGLGVVCVSTDQAELYTRHGVAAERVAVLPNLGIRASADSLREAARRTPEEWRGATAFFGRLSKQKGGQLLADLGDRLPAAARFRIFGDGYLGPRIAAAQPAAVMCGHVSQGAVTGVLMWARAVAFTSLWPEPGGIVGVDAQLMDVPVAAFDVGAPRYWPAARRFAPGDVDAMAAWLGGCEAPAGPRDPEAVARAQAGYWARIGARGAELLEGFVARGTFGAATADPAEELIRGR